MAQKRARRRFTREYKAQAVQRVIESGRPLADIAAELDVSPGQLDQLREGDVVVVARLDRLARSTRDLLEIAEILKEGGTGLRSLGEPWADTTSPAGGADGLRRHGGVRAGPHPPANKLGAGCR